MDSLDRTLHRLHQRRWLVPALVVVFLLLALMLVERSNTSLVPVLGVLPLLLLALYANLNGVWLLGLMAVPLSLNLEDLGAVSISVPSDLLAIGLLLVLVLKGRHTLRVLGKVRSHPIVLSLIVLLVWMLVCIVPSEMPVVSLKFWLNNLWFVAGFGVFSLLVFERVPRLITGWLWYVYIPLGLLLCYTLTNHALLGFSFLGSYKNMQPFFREHTIYAAFIALFAVAFPLLALHQKRGTTQWWLAGSMGVVLLAAVVLSYTRGAWLGVMVALGVWWCAKYWSWMKYALGVVLLGVAVVTLTLLSQDLSDEQSNDEDRGMLQHLQTAFDTKANTSNMERMNRWVAATSMLSERPVFGFGPGTYAFQYARFQRAEYKTYVSTNQGDIGTAHNEVLLALSEQGWLGGIWFGVLVLAASITGVRGYRRARVAWRRTGYAIATTGLLTYFAHSIVNNFLDQDKMAIPVFVCLAMIVALDRLHPEAAQPKSAAVTDASGSSV
jgi:O-antigen ligase